MLEGRLARLLPWPSSGQIPDDEVDQAVGQKSQWNRPEDQQLILTCECCGMSSPEIGFVDESTERSQDDSQYG